MPAFFARRVRAAAVEAARHCRERGADIADVALQFALVQPAIATTLVGMSRVEHVRRNVSLVGASPDPDLLADVRRILAPVVGTVWKEGRPENDDPGAVDKQS